MWFCARALIFLSYQQLNCFCKAKAQYFCLWRSGSLAHPVTGTIFRRSHFGKSCFILRLCMWTYLIYSYFFPSSLVWTGMSRTLCNSRKVIFPEFHFYVQENRVKDGLVYFGAVFLNLRNASRYRDLNNFWNFNSSKIIIVYGIKWKIIQAKPIHEIIFFEFRRK